MFDVVRTNVVLRELFPDIYQEEAQTLIAFLEAYYTWLEDSEYGQAKNLLTYRDIDNTLDDFIIFFKNKYLKNLPLLTKGNIRNFIKHSDDFYDVRGTEEGIKLLFNLLYDTRATVYKPGSDVIKASDGEWHVPQYLEVTISTRTSDYIAKEIVGASSGARAFVEAVIRKQAGGQYFDVVYISNLRGNFRTGERIGLEDESLEDAPRVIGSLNVIEIIDGGRDNRVGDIFNVISTTGKQALARVSNTFNGTGRVDFELEDGGTGYSINATAVVSNVVINISNITNANSAANGFISFETIEQRLANVSFLSANNTFTVGDVVEAYTSGTWVRQATGIVAEVNQTGANGNVLLAYSNLQSEFVFADTLRKQGNTISAVIDTYQDKTATANVVNWNSNSIGIHNVVNTFKNTGTRLRGRSSNTFANIVSFSTGSGADFNIGSITNEETVVVHTDIIGGMNDANVPYLYIKINGEGSGMGFVDSVVVTNPGSGYTNGTPIVFESGGSSVTSITINNPGTGYANGERVVFTSNTGTGASAIITTDGVGAIVGFTFANNGQFYSETPVVTIQTTSGTGASLTAVLGNPTGAEGTITTDGSGGITSVTITNVGSGYFYTPNVSVAGGTGATFTVNMDWGYGFPKNPQGDDTSFINALLNKDTMTIGTIASLTNISPGQNYNQNPFVRVVEPLISAVERKNFTLNLANVAGSFVEGEVVTQNFNENLIQLTYEGISGNTTFDVGEVISQGSANGVVYYRDGTVVRLANVNGTFVTTTGIPTQITGSVSLATANVTAVDPYPQSVIVRGVVDSYSNNVLNVKRLSFNSNFTTGAQITGVTSSAEANVISFTIDDSSQSMGNNAVVNATVRTANGIASTVEVIDSGFGYRQDDIVQLSAANNNFVITGRAVLQKQGTGQGFWKSTRGFLNSDKYIHDSHYYQTFSYEIQSKLSFDYYSDIVRQLLHIAGTEMFGKVVINSTSNVGTLVCTTSVTQS